MFDGKNHWTRKPPDERFEGKREGIECAPKAAKSQAKSWTYSNSVSMESGGDAYLNGRDSGIRKGNTYGNDSNLPKG